MIMFQQKYELMSLILLFLTFRGPTLGKVGVEFAKVSRNGTEQPPIKKQRVSVTEAIGKHGRGKIAVIKW